MPEVTIRNKKGKKIKKKYPYTMAGKAAAKKARKRGKNGY